MCNIFSRVLLVGTFVGRVAARLNASAQATLCGGAAVVDASPDWVWNSAAVPSPSCTSPNMENNARVCDGDPTSVVLTGHGGAQCLSSFMYDCKFNLRSVTQFDFDVDMLGCDGTWAAPLWITPNHWDGGGQSGEIDMLELCPVYSVRSNFAGGGYQVAWDGYNADSFTGHITMWIQDGGVSTKLCSKNDLQGGSCSVDGAAYYPNIFGANGCAHGDCIYQFVSDIWNGNSGDDGYAGCANGKYHQSAGCSTSVRNIRVQAAAGTFSGKCAALAGSAPPSPPSPPSRWEAHSNTNCYKEHGSSHDVDKWPGLSDVFGVVACEAACESYSGCASITVGSNGECYRHTGTLALSQCEADAYYTTLIIGGSPSPTPSPVPAPSPPAPSPVSWQCHGGTNCYVEHGSPYDIDTHPGLSGVYGVTACESACFTYSGCSAITVGSNGECYRHTGTMSLSQCVSDSYYATCIKSGGALVLPADLVI